MRFIKENKGKIFGTLVVATILLVSFFCEGEKADEQKVMSSDTSVKSEIVDLNAQSREYVEETPQPTTSTEDIKEEIAEKEDEGVNAEIPEPLVEKAEEDKKPEVSKTVEKDIKAEDLKEEKKSSCTVTVRCDTILKNLDKLAPEKVALIPEDGILLSETTNIADGESAFDVLLRELEKNKIHIEFQRATVYDSVYIEGIGNIYEMDCGELSGWMYRVNGEIPSSGCSLYKVQDGDCIEFLYTCNMGRDL